LIFGCYSHSGLPIHDLLEHFLAKLAPFVSSYSIVGIL
jgi:hypothetical protein